MCLSAPDKPVFRLSAIRGGGVSTVTMASMEKSGFLFDRSAFKGNMLILGKGSRSEAAAEDSSRRRPFLCFSEDYYDDEYYEEQMQEKKRRLTPDQVDLLEKTFEVENKLEPERKTELAKKLGVEPRQVAIWFQNRRARRKNKQLELDYDYLKSSYDSLMSNYDAVVKENEKLKSEVVTLSEKLQGKDSDRPPITDQLPAEDVDHPLLAEDIALMVEDRLSSRTGGSAVVDKEAPQLVDSGDSYFLCDDYSGSISTIPGSKFDISGQAVAEEEVPLAWWDWP
ncbi:hypothetical protein MLD38_001345 [Melastoma candidum]|uniref:Uncharacterized protein n=1 Tax=Melastoma candidum TaxID=119954 RepID=A0ACB9SEX2_9MYRT|nr:hypothetical protein MLD38_001345 [Melastoma candidum]